MNSIRLSLLALCAAGPSVGALGEPLQHNGLLDAPVWSDVTTTFYDTKSDPACTMRGSYFHGRFITAAGDTGRNRRRYLLRRRFTLRENAVEARLQGIGDGDCTFKVNGRQVLRTSYGYLHISDNRTGFADILPHVAAGENEIAVEYNGNGQCPGGAVLEVFVRYGDGSSERIDSDDRFESSVDGSTWTGVTLSDPPPAAPRVTRLAYRDYANPQDCLGGGPLAEEVAAGEKVGLRYTFNGVPPEGDFSVRVRLLSGTTTRWNEEITLGQDAIVRLGERKWELRFAFEAPLYFDSGSFTVDVESNSIWCRAGRMSGNLEIVRASSIPGYSHPPHVEMRMLGGSPTVHLDGKPFPMLWGGVLAGLRPDRVPRHSDMPLTAITVHNNYWEWHPRLGVYDFAIFDTLAERYRRSNPNAYFIWDLTIYPPSDFLSKYPGEMSADDTGDIKPVARFSWSFASRPALDEMKETIARAIAHVEASPYANRVIAYRVNSGTTIEWLGWDAKPGHVKDFSKPNQDAFRSFAAERYPELKDPHVPDLSERKALDREMGLLWNRRKHLNAIAYMDYNSWIVARDILETSGKAKDVLKSLGRQKLVGTYYGYTYYLNGGGGDVRRAHFALDELLSENRGRVDFLMSPNSYSQRNLGDTNGDMKPYSSIAMSGIMPIIEDDTRTHNRQFPFWQDYYQTHTPAQTAAVIRRNMGIVLCRNAAPYSYALCTGVDVDSPECSATGRAVLETIRVCQEARTKRNAEVALVVSEKSMTALPVFERTEPTGRILQSYGPDGKVVRTEERLAILNGEIANAVQTRFARSGAPFDQLLAEDLERHPGTYKLYVFLNALTYDDGFLRAVRRLRERGATLLWLYAPGYMKDNSLEDMQTLTDIRFARIDAPLPAAVTVCADGRTMGMAAAKMPELFRPERPDTVLGRYANGEPGLTASKTGKSQSFFSGTWQLDEKFVRTLIGRSGVHIYCDTDDPIEANENLFTLHARSGGRKTVNLPRKASRIVDIFEGREVARDTDTFAFDAEIHSSHLFYFGPDADRLLKALR